MFVPRYLSAGKKKFEIDLFWDIFKFFFCRGHFVEAKFLAISIHKTTPCWYFFAPTAASLTKASHWNGHLVRQRPAFSWLVFFYYTSNVEPHIFVSKQLGLVIQVSTRILVLWRHWDIPKPTLQIWTAIGRLRFELEMWVVIVPGTDG